MDGAPLAQGRSSQQINELIHLVNIALERLEERFHDGVVVHAHWPIHALNRADRAQPFTEDVTSKLAATITMEQQSGRWFRCAWMNGKTSLLARKRTGWLFLGARAPPSVGQSHA
jgi:hypothetical protein